MESKTPRHHKLFYGSSYDRGLDIILYMWSEIKEKYPDAELHICYGWNLYDIDMKINQERKQWKENVQKLMNRDGIFHYGRVGKKELSKIRRSCGIWVYPTYFPEINCITALDCQADGLVPVVVEKAALKETVQSGIKVKGDIAKLETAQRYQKELLELMGDKVRWEVESKKAKKMAKDYTWDKISDKWIEVFKQPISTPKVNVITPTIRTGFWNIMSANLASQTYKNFNWIIVDDYEEDRSDIAKKYAEKYKLDIKYLKSTPEVKRKYSLVAANNKAVENMDGELAVFLQDFCLIDRTGIEMLVDIYRHNPNSLIAPTDIRNNIRGEVNRKNKEDWFDGRINVIGEVDWVNKRNKNKGIRETDNAFDFEMNYGAIPVKVLRKLNGWWEFFDDGMGFDNTEIALRAINSGFNILIDDTNKAKCLNLWPIIKGEKENIEDREFNLNTPRWYWFLKMLESGKLPLIRDEKLDNKIHLDFKVPKKITEKEASGWINANANQIVEKWINTKKDI